MDRILASLGNGQQPNSSFVTRALEEGWPDLKAGSKFVAGTVSGAVSEKWNDLKTGFEICGEVAKGAAEEVRHHPVTVLEDAAEGAAVGAVLAVASPELAITAAVIGGAAMGYEIVKNVPSWAHDAVVFANPRHYSTGEFLTADKGLKSMGAGLADNAAAMVVGGEVSMYGRAAIRSFVASSIDADLPIGIFGMATDKVTGAQEIARFQTDQTLYNVATRSLIGGSNIFNEQSLSPDNMRKQIRGDGR
jgi:hypothetical protein